MTLNQVDRLLYSKQIRFCRFVDDYYLFADSQSDAFKALVYLSECLHRNQVLQLQKTKTRIMSVSEFLSTNPLAEEDIQPNASEIARARSSLMRISLHFDPYSQTAHEDYERLRNEIKRFPILDLIRTELSKSRVNLAVARKLATTLQFIDEKEVDDAAMTLIENEELLYPIYFNVMLAVKAQASRLKPSTRSKILAYIRKLIDRTSPVMSVDLNLQFAVRLLSIERSEESVSLLIRLHQRTTSEAIRRDIILAMSAWHEWIWLSDLKSQFRAMRPSERRAFIIASYSLKDEGEHWRKQTKDEFSPFEIVTRDWIAGKINNKNWVLPL